LEYSKWGSLLKGVSLVGKIPAGLPEFQLPIVNKEVILKLLPTVLTVALIGIVESIGIAKALESKHKDHTVVADQELIALGLAKVAGSFFQAIPTSGSFSRSAINSNSGAKTVVSGLVTVAMVILALLFMCSWFYYLPKGILAAIILLAVISLFDYKEAKYLWKTNRLDFWMMMATFFFTLALGIESGVLCGVLLSILAVLYNTSRPTMTELGHIEGTDYYRSISRYEQATSINKTLILRFENEIFFGNSGLFKDKVYEKIDEHQDDVKYVILDGSLISNIDSTGAHMLSDLIKDLKENEIEFHLCGAVGTLRDSLFKAGLLSEADKHHTSVAAAVTFLLSDKNQDLVNRPINPLQTNES